jgi:hypothetical protein
MEKTTYRELNDQYFSPNIVWVSKSRRMRWAVHVAHMGNRCGEPEGKRPLGRPRHSWEDNIKVHLQEVGCEGMDSISVAQDRDKLQAFENAVMNLRFS